jgi:hypothetical protein
MDGYSIKSVSTGKELIISNFGGSCLLLYNFESQEFFLVNLDSYESINSILTVEKSIIKNLSVIRKYPPGDLILIGSKLFVGQTFSEFTLAVDVSSREIVKRIPTGGEGEFAYSPKNNELYFASNTRNIFYIINPSSYKFEAIQYPESSLYIGSVFCHPESGLIYLGLHRTGKRYGFLQIDEKDTIANSFIAIYDPVKRVYIKNIELVVDESDKLERCWPSSMVYDESNRKIYVGMLGSPKNIYLIDTESNVLSGHIQSKPNKKKNQYVDSLSLALYKEYIISVNRSNYELAFIDKNTLEPSINLPLGGKDNGPRHICIEDDQAYISHWEYDGIIIVDLEKVINLLP